MKRIKHLVTNILVKHLLKAVTKDEVLMVSSREWIVGKRKLSQSEILDLKEEAASLMESNMYRLLLKELKYRATLQRFDKAVTADDMLYGKAMLYSIELIDLFIKNIKDL